ncbi:MAG: CRISPR-associated protein Cas4 [Candidatus Bipolaricaulaceae bacterium]
MRPDLPISLVAEYAYCPRAAWLSYVAGQFQPNEFIVEGEILHRRVHRSSGPEGKPKRWRKLSVWSERYGIYGYADLVEERPEGVIPVEYKRGKAVPSWSDRIHLALVVLCLEEMLCVRIGLGFLYYFGSRKRVSVEITQDLRRAAINAIRETRDLVAQGTPPSARPSPKCRGCALAPVCFVSIPQTFAWPEWTE